MVQEWAGLEADAGRAFLTDKLSDLVQRRTDLERGIAEADEALRRLASEQVTAETVRSGLERFGDVLDALTPFERKELVRLVVHRGGGRRPPDRAGDVPRHAPRTGDASGPCTL